MVVNYVAKNTSRHYVARTILRYQIVHIVSGHLTSTTLRRSFHIKYLAQRYLMPNIKSREWSLLGTEEYITYLRSQDNFRSLRSAGYITSISKPGTSQFKYLAWGISHGVHSTEVFLTTYIDHGMMVTTQRGICHVTMQRGRFYVTIQRGRFHVTILRGRFHVTMQRGRSHVTQWGLFTLLYNGDVFTSLCSVGYACYIEPFSAGHFTSSTQSRDISS